MSSPVIVPSSNLNFVSKVLERIIHARISSHLESFPSITPFQSAYRQFHSTETAILRIQNLLLAINKQKVSALVLLDLSAAFDTIDHKILLSRFVLFLWSLKHSIEFNCFLSLESNTISFYSVTFHSTFQHFHRYTTGFCPWSSSLFVVHKPCQSNLYKGFDFISFIC